MTDCPARPDNLVASPRWRGDQCDAYDDLTSDVGPESVQDECPDFIAGAPVNKSHQGGDGVVGTPPEGPGHVIPMKDNFSKPESEFDCPAEDCCDDEDQHDASDDAEVNSTVSDDPDQQDGSDYQGNNTSMSEGEDDSVTSHDYRMSSNSSQPSFTRPSHVADMEMPDPIMDSNRTSCCSFSEAKSEDEKISSSCNTTTLEPRFTAAIYTASSKPSSDLTSPSPLPMDAGTMRASSQSTSDEAVDFRAAFKSNEFSNADCSKNFISSGSLTSSLLAAVNAQDSNESNQAVLSAMFVNNVTFPSPTASSQKDAEDSCAVERNLFTKDRNNDMLPKSEINSADAPSSDHSSVMNTTVPLLDSVSETTEDTIPVCTARVRKLRSRSVILNSCATSTKKQARSKIKRRSAGSSYLHESLATECNSLPDTLELLLGVEEGGFGVGNSVTRCTSPATNSMPAILIDSESANEHEKNTLSLNIDALRKDLSTPSENLSLVEKESELLALQSHDEPNLTVEFAINREGSILGEDVYQDGISSPHAVSSESTDTTDLCSSAIAIKQSSSLSCNQENVNENKCASTNLTADENSKLDCGNIPDDSGTKSHEKIEADSSVEHNNTCGSNTDDLPALENETNSTSQNESQCQTVASDHSLIGQNFHTSVGAGRCCEDDAARKEGIKLKNRKRSSIAVLDDVDDLPNIDNDVRSRKPNKGFKKMFEILSENIEELPDIDEPPHKASRTNQQKRKRLEECPDDVCGVACSEPAISNNLEISSEKPIRKVAHQDTAVSSSSQSAATPSADKNPVSVAGSSRDTAEELSARYYQNYLRYNRRIADYERRLREQFTDSDSDDSTDHYKKEADRKRWIEKKNILKDKMNQLIELNGGPFNVGLPHENKEDDSCGLPSLYSSSGAEVAAHTASASRDDVRRREAANNGDSDDDIIVDDEGSFQGRQKQGIGSWRRRPRLWLRKRKCEDADVVDLTNDVESDADDGDVEVLQHDKPVVYLKTESRRKRRRTSRVAENSSSAAAAAAQTIDLDNPEPAPPPQPIDFSDPNLLFGTLLEQPDRFILPKQTDDKQDPDKASDLKDLNGPRLLAAMGPLSLHRSTEGGNDGGAMWGETESSDTFTDTKASVQPVVGQSTSDNNASFSRGSPSGGGSNSSQFTDKAAAMEKIWQMLNVPDDDLVQCRSRQQASESAIPPALESAHLAAFGRSATPPSPYRTAPPPGCCPDYDSLHDTAVRQGSSEPTSRPLPPVGAPDSNGASSSDGNEDDASQQTSSGGFAQVPGRKDVFRPATRSRGMIDFDHGAQPQRINIGNSVRNILNQGKFGSTDGTSSNPFNFGSRASSSFLPIDRPGSSGRLSSTAGGTSNSQDLLNSHVLNPVSCMRATLRRHQHPTFQSSPANDLSVNSVFGNDPDTPVGPSAGRHDLPSMRRTPIGLDIPPAHSCSRVVTRSSSLASEAISFPYIRTHNFVGFQPSTSYSDTITAAVASIPLPPSVPTQTSNSNLYAFVGTSRSDVPLNLEQRNTGPGRPGPSRALGSISTVDSGSGTSGPVLNTGNNSNNPTPSSSRTTRSSNSLMYLERNPDVHFVGANVTVMVDDDDEDDTEADEVGGDTDASSPNSQEQNVPESKPSSSTSAPDASNNTSSAGKDDIDISCPICFDSLADIKERRGHLVSTICGHLFCEGCLDAAVRRHKQCPKCRKKLTKRQFHKLYL
ncbi:Zinc finger RING-type [Trinorchestia longiramus]|nr:Zinc finger RING-type [Trinorchestia longiramus]